MIIDWKTWYYWGINSSPRLIYKFKAIPIKISAGFFGRYWQDDSKVYMGKKGSKRAKTIVKRENQGKRLTLPDFKEIAHVAN